MITITQFPQLLSGVHEEGELIEMLGDNLDELPAELIVTYDIGQLNSTRSSFFWPLHHVSEDGKTAWFIQQENHSYLQGHELNIFATGLIPPRVQWTDYQYTP